jgi:hypothetical protein
MSYSDEELNAAVTNIVRDSIRYDFDSLGTRKTGTTFNDVQDAAAGLFIARDGAPFFVVSLARDRLLEVCEGVREQLNTLSRYITAVGRRVSPVTRTRSLNNARVALDALAQATARRTGAYSNIEGIPAFLRFDRNTDKFLREESQKVNNGGDIIETSEQARSLIRPALRKLRNDYDELIRKTEVLAGSIPGYQALDLPASLTQTVLENASSVLQDRIDQLEELTPQQRLTILREVTLDVLATKSTVRGFGSLEPPTIFLLLEGTGSLYSDDTHPAVPAELMADLDGGYIIHPDQRYLGFTVDSAYSFSYPPPGSYKGALDLVGLWPRRLEYGGSFEVVYSDDTSGEVTLPITLSAAGTSYQAYDFVDEVNTQLGANTAFVEAVMNFSTPYTTLEVDITFTAGSSADFTADPSVDFVALGVQAGDLLVIQDSSSAMNRYNWIVSTVSGNVINASNTLGATPVSESDIQVTVGPVDSEYPTIQFTGNASTPLQLRRDLTLRDIDEGTVIQLGTASGARSRCSRTRAQDVANDLNTSPFTFVSGAPRLEGGFIFEPDFRIGTTLARSHPEDPSSVSLYLYRGQAEVQNVAGDTVQLELLDDPPTILDDDFKAVIIREAPDEADVGNHGEVDSLLPGDLLNVPLEATTALNVGDIVTIEYGWDYFRLYGQSRQDFFLEIDPALLNGPTTFEVLESVDSATTGLKYPFQVQVDPTVLDFSALGGQPTLFEATVGRRRAVFRSLDTTLASKVVATATSAAGTPPEPPAHAQFFSSDPAEAVATTEWVLLPEIPARLEVGDVLEVHLTDPSSPDLVSTIQTVEEENNLIRLDQFVPADFAASLNFSTLSPPPFARIRKTVVQNFSDLEAALEVWLNLPKNKTLSTFRQLDSAVNAVLVNQNPTQAQTGTVTTLLQQLDATVESLEQSLDLYRSSTVDEVRTLIKGFREKGCDRAVDVLLEGDFQGFFNLTANDASYAGHLQRTIRDVEREDLPVRRDNRRGFEERYDAVHIATIEDYDPELVTDEGDPLERIDIPELNDVLPGLPVP